MRTRFLFSLLAGTFLAFSAQAQMEIDIGQNDAPAAASEAKTAKTEPDPVVTAEIPDEKFAAPEKEKSGGMFSFLNFSFLKKKDPQIIKEAEEHQETFLQTVTRKAEEGNVDAQLSLGYMYLYGDEEAGVVSDYKKAFEYYALAAAQGDNVAINNLGSLYYSGVGTKKNPYKAAALFTKAAELGNIEASVNLAFLYLSGSGVAQDNTKAMNYFAKASSQNNLTAQYMMGYAYYRGFVIPKDYKKAFNMLREPAQAGFDEAQYAMAIMYLNGEGITKNYGNAVKYLGNSFMQGNVRAMVKLADILAAGEVYPKNIYQAHVLYNIASVRGAPEAAAKRDELEKHLKIDEILQAQSEAEKFKDQPKELTNYIRKTFGSDIYNYIDEQMPATPKNSNRLNAPASAPVPVYNLPQTAPEPEVPQSRRLL